MAPFRTFNNGTPSLHIGSYRSSRGNPPRVITSRRSRQRRGNLNPIIFIILLAILSASCGLIAPFSDLPEEDTTTDPAVDDTVVDDTGSEEIESSCGNGIVVSGEDCDDGNDINGDGCDNDCTYSCVDNEDCDDGHDCTVDECGADHVCSNTLADNTVICREAVDSCDRVETCDGWNEDCPDDAKQDDGFVCETDPRSICLSGGCAESFCGDGFIDLGAGESCEPPSTGNCTPDCLLECEDNEDCPDDGEACNGEEYCDMESNVCDRRNPLEDGTECGSAPRHICIARTCQESTCGDGYADDVVGEECDDGNDDPDDGCEPDTCLFTCHEETQAEECDDDLPCSDDICTMDTHICMHTVSNNSTICRAASGDCDVAEYCNGIYTTCPTDEFQPDTSECRPSAGDCDVAEYCTGTSAECPIDQFYPEGTPCDDGDDCTHPDECDGSGLCEGISAGLDGVLKISAGPEHTCALFDTGGVKCWGKNYYGQLGDGSTENRIIPLEVSGLSSDVIDISSGYHHTCTLLAAGGVMCWGRNSEGQLGDGSTENKSTPVSVSGLSSEVTAISSGNFHTCALLVTGGVKCWGYNGEGQVGDGTTVNRITPIHVSGLTSGVLSISSGGNHSCALIESGDVKCWGYNAYGQLGDGTTTDSVYPITVSGLTAGVSSVSAGFVHTCVLMDTGGVKCWGHNANGALGDGTTTLRLVPTDVPELSSGVSAISSGHGSLSFTGAHTCALMDTGGVKCWGFNFYGQLGDATSMNRTSPANVSGLPSGLAGISAGGVHTCAVLSTGGAKCWGQNHYGQLGDGTTSSRINPITVRELPIALFSISSGGYHTCSILLTGEAKCWGSNNYGELGDGTTNSSVSPIDVTGLSSVARVISAGIRYGGSHTCAILDPGTAKCWGVNRFGQLGNGTTENSFEPVNVVGLSTGVSSISCGVEHTCALLDTGGIECWGYNSSGQLGDGTTDDRTTPVVVSGLTTGVVAVSAGYRHTCALLDTGAVKCWGENNDGQLGDETTNRSSTPVDVSGLSAGVSTISTGGDHTCALLETDGIKCWGDNLNGQIGDGTNIDRLSPVDVVGLSSGLIAIDLGRTHSCALLSTGGVKCWGSNYGGQLGDATTTDRTSPVDVSGLSSGVLRISAGSSHTCAIIDEIGVKCWGFDQHGQVSGFFPGYPHPVVCE